MGTVEGPAWPAFFSTRWILDLETRVCLLFAGLLEPARVITPVINRTLYIYLP